MAATENICAQLRGMGFEHKYTHQDTEIHYEVFKYGYTEVTVCHTDGKCTFDVNTEQNSPPLLPAKELFLLTRILNGNKNKLREVPNFEVVDDL